MQLDAVFLAEDQFARLLGHVAKAFDKAAGAVIGQRQVQPQPVKAVRQVAAQRLVAQPHRRAFPEQEAEDKAGAAFQHGLLVPRRRDGFVTDPRLP